MDFFKEFSKQFTNVARSVSEKSKESAEVSKLNGELRAVGESLEQLYARYGRLMYDAAVKHDNVEGAEEIALRIRATRLQAQELGEQLAAARELKRCPVCGAISLKEARYCAACGRKLPEEAPRPEPVTAGEYCPNCGAAFEGGEARCPVCGADFKAAPNEPPASIPTMTAFDGPDVEEPDQDGE